MGDEGVVEPFLLHLYVDEFAKAFLWYFGPLAQWLKRRPSKPEIMGSIPIWIVKFVLHFSITTRRRI